jgi:hypothetical protein
MCSKDFSNLSPRFLLKYLSWGEFSEGFQNFKRYLMVKISNMVKKYEGISFAFAIFFDGDIIRNLLTHPPISRSPQCSPHQLKNGCPAPISHQKCPPKVFQKTFPHMKKIVHPPLFIQKLWRALSPVHISHLACLLFLPIYWPSWYFLVATSFLTRCIGSAWPSRPCRPLFLSRGMPIASDLSDFPSANSSGNGMNVCLPFRKL